MVVLLERVPEIIQDTNIVLLDIYIGYIGTEVNFFFFSSSMVIDTKIDLGDLINTQVIEHGNDIRDPKFLYVNQYLLI